MYGIITINCNVFLSQVQITVKNLIYSEKNGNIYSSGVHILSKCFLCNYVSLSILLISCKEIGIKNTSHRAPYKPVVVHNSIQFS